MKLKGYNIVNSVYKQCPYMPNAFIIDIKLDVFGPSEDYYYTTLPFILKNIRRGITLVAFAE